MKMLPSPGLFNSCFSVILKHCLGGWDAALLVECLASMGKAPDAQHHIKTVVEMQVYNPSM